MPKSPYATRPYCLDSEFLPRSLLDQGIAALTPDIEKKRRKAVYREFIRSLVFSPQVVIGREATAGHPVLAEAVKSRQGREAITRLLAKDRLYVLLMTARGYQENSLSDFFAHTLLRFDPKAAQAWADVINDVGDARFPYLKLNQTKSVDMESRFTSFFSLHPDHPSLLSMLGAALGGEPTGDQYADFREFWKSDLREFIRFRQDNNEEIIYRTTIYDEYIRPKSPAFLESVRANIGAGKATDMEQRRDRIRAQFKLITDLAYNANAPTTLNIMSFVPPGMPDPVSLPMHLFHAVDRYDPVMERHEHAVREAYANIVDMRAQAGMHFFYHAQAFQHLPDIGSFTLRDAVDIMEWDEWVSFKAAQYAALRFEHAEELEGLMHDYWATIVRLHERLEVEANRRSHWMLIGSGTLTLSMAVTAHVMGHALLPDLIHHAPWWATVAAATAVAQPIHAGLDIIVNGVEGGLNRLELGFKDGGMREFTISEEMRGKLEELQAAEAGLHQNTAASDAIIADASRRLAAKE